VEKLAGNILIATPALHGTDYNKALIYIFSHSEKGSVGMVINQLIKDTNVDYGAICDQLEITVPLSMRKRPIHFGGTMETARGFIVHTRDDDVGTIAEVQTPIALSSNVDILRRISEGEGPAKSFFALGYALWEPNELEQELRRNAWLLLPGSEEMVFDGDPEQKWRMALGALGIDDPSKLVYSVGSA
jgi:putative transcriptional regulator